MKIFHIVEEVSQKNNSIVSVVKILLKYENHKESKIIIPNTNNSSRQSYKNIKQIKIFKNLIKYKSEIQDFLIKTKPDIIHIHGLWRPIHILFIYVSSQLNIPLIIQPHGMLLDEAIKAKSKFNYLIKLFIIKIYKQLLTSAIFIAVTDEEKKSILKYFRTKNIEVITNPFETTFKVQKQLKKNISYFGRYSPHKNLDLIIKSFLESKLGKDWKLTIYGIDDDSSYKKNILNLIKNSNKKKRIYIKKPIFDKNKKFKKMSESFLNVLMSKSEILSLSVLEGLSVGTRSLVNNEIKYPKKISNLLYNTKPEKKLIAKKLNQITKNFSNKYRERINIKNQFKKIYFSEISQKKYNNLTMGINKLKKKTLEINFFNISIANGLNSFLVPFLVVIYGLINSKISAEIGIIEGTIIYLTQIFSSNTRTILLNEKNDRIFDNFISFRSIISVVIFLIFTIFFANIEFIEGNFHKILIILILLSWINEITLVYIEKNNLRLLMKIFISFSVIFYSLLIIDIFSEKLTFYNVISIYLTFHLLFLFYFFNLNTIINFKYKTIFLYKNIFPFLSTLTNTTSILFWRYSILFFTSKELAGIIFAIFSIASFPGTFYNNILGQTILRNKKLNDYFNKYENIFYSIFIIVVFVFYILIKNSEFLKIDSFIVNTLLISLIGTIIMIKAIRKRHYSIYKYFENRNLVFKTDIVYSLIIFPLILILYNYKGIDGISFAYLFSALISFILYSRNYGKLYK